MSTKQGKKTAPNTHWSEEVNSLIGKKIESVRHLTSYEVELMSVPVDAKNSTVLEFSDGTYAIVMSDWEGNGFGALWVGEYERVGVK